MIGPLILKTYKQTVHNIVDNTSSWDFNSSPPPATKTFKKYSFLFIRVYPPRLLILRLDNPC